MTIASVHPNENFTLTIVTSDGRTGIFDVAPYLHGEAFEPLRDFDNFRKVRSGGYYIEWECDADLSADTIESKWVPAMISPPPSNASSGNGNATTPKPPKHGSPPRTSPRHPKTDCLENSASQILTPDSFFKNFP